MGGLNRFQEEAVRYYVNKRCVWDLGAGYLGWSKKLIEYGALSVFAVDQMYKDDRENGFNECRAWKNCAPTGVQLRALSFAEYWKQGNTTLSVAFVSWPEAQYSKTMGLELITTRADTVIYLGKNLDGVSCGSSQFWNMQMKRKVLCYLPSRRNTLIVYGPELKQQDRPLLLEEIASLGPHMPISSPDWYPER